MMTAVILAGALPLTVAFVVGLVVGAAVGAMSSEVYLTKRECRECMRRIAEYGFAVDGKDYKAVEDRR